jgi:hypothetical protein
MHELGLLLPLLLFLLAFLGIGLAFELAASRLLPRPLGLFDRLVLGIGAALPLSFLLAAAGLLGPAGALLLAGVAALGLAWAWARRREELAAMRPRPGKAELLPLLLLAVSLLPVYWIAINPTVHWDAAVYHLTLPRIYLETGSFAPLPMNVYSYWPHGPQLLYAFGLLFGGPPLAKLLHFASALLILAGLHQALRQGGQPFWRFGAWLAITGFLMHPLVLFEMQTAYVDLTQALFFFAAFLFLSRLDDESKGGHLLMAGLACGAVAVCKPTGALFLPALAPLLLPWWLAERRAGRAGQALFGLLTRFAPPILLLTLPWVWRSYQHTGNPVYPFWWKVFGGPDWNAELGEKFFTWQRGIGMGREPLDYLLLPWRVLTQGDRGYANFDGRLALPLLLLLILAIWRATKPEPPRLLRPALWVSALYFVLWAASSHQMRFLIPILPLLALAAGLAAADQVQKFGRRPLAANALALFLPLAVLSDPDLLEKGLKHAAIYRDSRFVADPWGAAPPFREKVLQLPKESRLLLINWNQGYFVPRPYLADSFFEASQVAAWLEDVPRSQLPAKLAERGVTHVLFHRGWRVAYPPALVEMLADQKNLRPIWVSPEDSEWILFELVQ